MGIIISGMLICVLIYIFKSRLGTLVAFKFCYYSPYGTLLELSAEPVVIGAGEVCIPPAICEPADEIIACGGIPAEP